MRPIMVALIIFRLHNPTFLMDFCFDNPIDTKNVHTKFEVLALPIPEIRGVPKKLDCPWIRQRSLFSKTFNGPLFGCTL